MKTENMWALYNFSIIVCVRHLRRECIDFAEKTTDEDWKKCKKYYSLKKVIVIEDLFSGVTIEGINQGDR